MDQHVKVETSGLDIADDNTYASEHVVANMKTSKFSMQTCHVQGRVTEMTSHADHVFVAVAGHGCKVFRIDTSSISPVGWFDKETSVYELHATSRWLVYLKEDGKTCAVCVLDMTSILNGVAKTVTSHDVIRRPPLVVEPVLDMVVIGGAAWASTWTSTDDKHGTPTNTALLGDCRARAFKLPDFHQIADWQVTQNAIAMLRSQRTHEHSMLGVSDTCTGLTVYDLREPDGGGFDKLYYIPVEEIRNFELAGNVIAVFHRFEPNVSFWNVAERKTILCINIQDQMKELRDDLMDVTNTDDDDDDDIDCGVFGDDDDDDHVTSVTSLPTTQDGEHLLLYGTRSGCVFGLSVDTRRRLFNLPCPVTDTSSSDQDAVKTDRQRVQGLCFMPNGRLVALYEKSGLVSMDYSI